jgi:uncharacterized membrane protein
MLLRFVRLQKLQCAAASGNHNTAHPRRTKSGAKMMNTIKRSSMRALPAVLATATALVALGVGGNNKTYTFQPIDDPSAGPGGTSVFGINSAGVMSGNYGDTANEVVGFYLSAGQFTTVTVPGSSFTELAHINGRGTAVGDYINAAGEDLGFTYSADGTITYLPDAAPGAFTIPIGINDPGKVAGYYTTDNYTTAHGFIYAGGSFSYFDAPGSSYTVPWAITNSGTVGGWFIDAAGHAHGFLRDRKGAFTQIDVPAGTRFTTVYGLNDNGDIVGSYGDATTGRHGYLLRKGVFLTLDYPGATNTDAFGINDPGAIVGTYNNFTRGFLATPGK